MSTEPLKPRVIEGEGRGTPPRSMPQVVMSERTDRVVAVQPPPKALPVPAPPKSRLRSFGVTALGVGVAGWFIVDAYWWIAAAFERSTMLGTLAATAVVALVAGAGAIIAREVTSLWRLRNVDIGSYVDMSADELWDLPEVRHIFDETRLGKKTPSPPVLVVQAVHDPIISVDDIDQLVRTYENNGTAVTYHRDPFCDHLLLHPLSAPMTLRWLRHRFAGRALSEHRTRTKWPTVFNPSTHLGMLRLAVITVKLALGRSVERHPLSKTDAR